MSDWPAILLKTIDHELFYKAVDVLYPANNKLRPLPIFPLPQSNPLCSFMHVLIVLLCFFFSAYEQKRAAAGGAKSSCPGTPMSPMQQHYSPKPAAAGRPDAGYMNPTAASQPLPSNSYPINAR